MIIYVNFILTFSLFKDIINNNLNIYNLLTASSVGDLNTIIILYGRNIDLNSYDYDKRTALHLACSECHIEVVKYLIKKGVNINCQDRWNNKPIDDIIRFKNNLLKLSTVYKNKRKENSMHSIDTIRIL